MAGCQRAVIAGQAIVKEVDGDYAPDIQLGNL